MTDRIGLVYAKLKLKFWNLSDYVWSVMKTRQDNDMTNHIGAVYTKNETSCHDRFDLVHSVMITK